ncbi:MAG: trimethylamine methyltransferase family protein, partial [Promethearchaeati archaeon]
MKLSRLKVLTGDDLKEIHETTIELLEDVGIRVESEEIRVLLKKYGALINEEKKGEFVKFPRNLIMESIKKVPKEFSLWGPDGSYNFTINTSSTKFGTFGAAINIYDPSRKKEIRKSKLEDTINHIRVVNELENIDCSHMDVWPSDVPFTELHFHTLREWGRYAKKPYGMGCYGRTASLDMIKIASIISGNIEEIQKRPRLLGVFNPTSPLTLPKILLNGLEIFAKFGQPINISAAALAGSSAPVTLAGVLIQANMEVLSAIVITQLINPGTPVLYGSTNTIMDPSTGNPAYGSIEMGLITIGSAQLTDFYGIPSKGSGALTESKCFDIQNGYERFMTLFCAANAGHNYVTCAGTYETSLSEALELLAIDDELIGVIKRGMDGFQVNEYTLAKQEIRDIANGIRKSYLGTKHSVKFTRKEIFNPSLIDRNRRGLWIKNGRQDMFERAQEKIEQILNESIESKLTKIIESELNEYYK